ncbi:hypothetical protein QAD02_019130 [Eretmocerus hayati]|uniref:Uncharacterized protein n=1 Tax=Eretmocerus hayati TaxID=131215 RepID=A0ACC2PJW2_9HYME|nr:hypothetical protein QAD02_019130 [Eretmocerus hayati]
MARYLGLVVLVVLASVACAFADDSEEKYSDKYDYVLEDIQGILNNNRKRHQYESCFMGDKPCLTGDAIFLKQNLPEAMVTKCKKCTERQRDAFSVVADWYAEHDPKTWDNIIRKSVEEFTARGVMRRLKEKEERARKEKDEQKKTRGSSE